MHHISLGLESSVGFLRDAADRGGAREGSPAGMAGCDRPATDHSFADQALGAVLVQPDQTTCGASVLVVARMLNDEAYAVCLVNGSNPA